MFEKLSRAVETGDLQNIKSLVLQAVQNDLPALEILNRGLLPGIEKVGEKFGRDELFIPEVMLCAKVLQEGIDVLRPLLQNNSASAFKGRLVLGTVAGDIHDIGKNLVKMMFIANGFEVFDLGINVAPEKFAAAIEAYQPHFVGLSALLTTTMPQMAATVEYLDVRGLRNNKCRIMVGGAPVTAEFADSIGADLYADNAIEAVAQVKKKAVGD